MTDEENFASLAAAVEQIAAIDPDVLDRPVPSCPGWVIADLVGHVGHVHRWATEIIETRATTRPPFAAAELPGGDEIIPFFQAGADALVNALRAADLDETVFTFAGPAPARWWLRRQTQETLIHAWDACSAVGELSAIPAEAAVEGIDEFFDVFIANRFDCARFAASRGGGTGGETMHLHATDCDGEWLARFDIDEIVVSREHGKADVALRGPASDLLLVLWNRVDRSGLDRFGDVLVVDRFLNVAKF